MLPVLTTARTLIRRISESDYGNMMEVYGDEQLMQFVGDSTAISEVDCRRWIDVTLNNYQIRGYGLFLIESLSTAECMGFVGLTHPANRKDPEIKYVLKKQFLRQGLAQEVISGLCKFAAQEWSVGTIVATVYPENVVSLHILSKCGFVRQVDRVDDDGTSTAIFTKADNFD